MGDPVLCPVDDPFIALFYGRTAHIAGIAARVGFREPPCPEDLSRGQERQELLLLALVAKGKDMPRTKGVMSSQAKPDGATDRGDLPDDGYIFEVGQAGTAIFFGYDDSHHSKASQFFKNLVWESLLFVPFRYIGFDVLICKISGRAAHLLG